MVHLEGGGRCASDGWVEVVLLAAPGSLEAWVKGRSAANSKAYHPSPQMALLYLHENALGARPFHSFCVI